jgi:uridine kinase
MIGIMDDLKIEHDQDGKFDTDHVSKEVVDEFYKRIDQLPQKKDCDMMIYDLVVAIAIEAGLMTEEQSTLPEAEVVRMEGYKTVFDNIAEIVREFTKA